MKFETKFDLGQTVHVFARAKRTLSDPCPVCGGKGDVETVGADGSKHKVRCPAATYRTEEERERACRVGRIRSVWYDLWDYAGTASIGRVEVTAYDPLFAPSYADRQYEEQYMIDTTGVGSGTVYTFDPEADAWSNTWLFATQDEGQAWADEQNEPLRAEAEEKRARMRDQVPA